MIKQIEPDLSKIPGGWKPNTNIKLDDVSNVEVSNPLDNVFVIDNFLSENDVDKLIKLMDKAPAIESVGVNGFMDVNNSDNIGSKRVTMWTEELSSEVWKKLKDINILDKREMNNFSPTDWWQGDKNRKSWKPFSVSPMMRFMKYKKNGEHYSHYDAGYIYEDDNYRTLMSYVIYLADCKEGGATRFIEDNQKDIPIWEREHLDWERKAKDDEVIYAQIPKKGTIMMFDHRLCHDVEQYMGDTDRIIIRGDIIFNFDK